ncbi:hypothetical protein [Chromobacterium haemolyticum]|uniref:hypothetical protein n=1 Tax=Chromobacterium haemolyticum TaxID=394935 RepID=UPI0024492703|nr:hypothetical protein [Chromobacterium haemolyticum]MDH0342018.1 hypothetical protein [Chromobacterium haemolyticum]
MKFGIEFDIHSVPPSKVDLARRRNGILMPFFLALGIGSVAILIILIPLLGGAENPKRFLWASYLLFFCWCVVVVLLNPVAAVLRSLRPISADDCVAVAEWCKTYPEIDRYVSQVLVQEREVVLGEFIFLAGYVAEREETAKRDALYKRSATTRTPK